MPSARHDFLDRHRALSLAINDAAIQPASPLTADQSNARRMLRNGLAIVLFCSLEDFIRRIAAEHAASICQLNIPFSNLTPEMQFAATHGVLTALRFRSRLYTKRSLDYQIEMQQHAQFVASTAGTGYTLSELAFGASESNLNPDTVRAIAKSFYIKDVWEQIRLISSRIGFGGLPMRDAYKTAMKTRHEAAHDSGADIEVIFLNKFLRDSLSIAIAFDCLLWQQVADLRSSKTLADTPEKRLVFRFLDTRRDGKLAENMESARRAYRVHTDAATGHAAAIARARHAGQPLIVRLPNSQPVDWAL